MTKGENNEKIMELAKELPESDAPTVNIGSGEIAGGGYKGEDDIKVSRKAQKKLQEEDQRRRRQASPRLQSLHPRQNKLESLERKRRSKCSSC